MRTMMMTGKKTMLKRYCLSNQDETPIKHPKPRRLTVERRSELERFRFYNTSLDEAMEELSHVEEELAQARDTLQRLQHP